MSTIKIVAISDTHNMLHKVQVPEGDLLIHSGDATGIGNAEEIIAFNTELGKIKHKFKYGIIFVPGNHDLGFERHPEVFRKLLSNATTLINEEITIAGLRIYGSPVTPYFRGWAFNVFRGEEIAKYWNLIPQGIDVLVTHGMPYDILDIAPGNRKEGCKDLLKAIKRIKPKIYIGGHLHTSGGQSLKKGKTTFYNAAICTEEYKPVNQIHVIEVKNEI